MPIQSRGLSVVMIFTLLVAAVPALGQAEQKPEQLWDDFIHYVRIARPDLAQAAAESLMSSVDDQQLLDILEAYGRPQLNMSTLNIAIKIPSLKPTAEKLKKMIEDAQIGRAREPQRIKAAILALAKGRRARETAIKQLQAAGQFAAPYMLQFLLDQNHSSLHPYILPAMVAIGREMVYPLSIAMPQLGARPQGQVAHVLTELGYPRAIPYFKEVLENSDTDPSARSIVEAGYVHLIKNTALAADTSAAELFLLLGRRHYTAGTLDRIIAGYDHHNKVGIIWKYNNEIGLVKTEVPGPIYPDSLAMKASERSLTLNDQMVQSHSLWLTSNLRRENRLGDGEDRSYHNPRTAGFHARMAGPQRLHDVLERSLKDGDTDLARDAIAALDDTAGTAALINEEGLNQPLLQALGYPDRRVRFESAQALTNARPKTEFPSHFRVVPVLAEAVRQTATRYAVVLGRDEDSRNKLAAVAKQMNFTPLPGNELQDVTDAVNNSPGVDMIMLDLDLAAVENVLNQSAEDYQLAAIPILAFVSRSAEIELTARYADLKRLFAVHSGIMQQPERLQNAVNAASSSYAGKEMTPEEATKYALVSLSLLRDVALSAGEIYKVIDAQPALEAALKDQRDEVVIRAAEVLAILENDDAQQAIANAALDPARLAETRISLLASLAGSVKSLGNRLTEAQVLKVIDMVKTSEGDMALAAARVHGSLMPPTVNPAKLILESNN